ncbi:MAG: PrpF domain-containing protein, partial [Pseudonocardiaceae bacterium]
RNNGDTVVCGVDAASADEAHFTVRFHRHQQPRLSDLLLFGEPVTDLDYPGGRVRISGVSIGNPYVFVDAADLGRPSPAELFADDQELFTTLGAVRRAAEQRLGWPAGTFPKVAALLPDVNGTVAARAISVPSWHPTLALTGVTCLAVASVISGTVPSALCPEEAGRLMIRTAKGRTSAQVKVTGKAPDPQRLDWVSVSGKVARFVAAVDVPTFARCPAGPRMSALTTDRAKGA